MRALVTGGAGFVGSHLAKRLLDLGNEVCVLDDLSTGRLDNLNTIQHHCGFRFQLGSIRNDQVLADLVSDADVIFHLAAAVGLRIILENPVASMQTNVEGTDRLLHLAAEAKKRVLITSTIEVYGKSRPHPVKENDDLALGPSVNCRWSYACGKAMNEFAALAYYRERKLPVTIVRLCNTIGRKQVGKYGMVLPSFISQAVHGEPVTVFGSGEQLRCFVAVQDVVEGMLRCMSSDRAVGEIFNIGTTESTTINQLARKVITATNSPSTVLHVPYCIAYKDGFEDIDGLIPDISKARRFIGYEPSLSLDDVIEDLVRSDGHTFARKVLPNESLLHSI
jgi:UDP-glucose 4-epimerase